jgi:glucosylceramidase
MRMSEKVIRYKIRRLAGLTIVLGMILVNIQCQRFSGPNVVVYSSSRDGDRLTKVSDLSFMSDKESSLAVIKVDEGTSFQKIEGFGATFNEAGMICLNSLNEETKDSVLKMLFDPESGAGYTLMKSPVGACDFASAGPWYTYNDTPGDTSMNHFTIERDLGPNGLVTYIKAASKYGRFGIESPMDFAPDWMYFGLKIGEKHIKPEYYRALARYYSKYIQAYASNGITINYLNLFNEGDNPHYSNVTYKAMGEMIKNFVVPQLRADGLSTKIQLGETCTRPEALAKFPPVLEDPDVRKYISSLTSHGYDWDKQSCLMELHNKFPDIPIWQTEVCYGMQMCIPPTGLVKCPVYEFSDGEFWGNMIVNDMKNWVSGWIYWNMILDQKGGPWLIADERGDPDNNSQHPVVIVDRNTKEVTYSGLYYYLAHFSKFVRPGAYRINTMGGNDKLNFVGFKNADGNIVLNVVNNSNKTECKVSWMKKNAVAQFKAHSITTLIWNTTKK